MSNEQYNFVILFELFARKNTFEVWRPLTGPPFPAGGLEFCCLSLNDSWVRPLFTCHLNIFRFILRSYCLLTDHAMDSSPPAWLNYLNLSEQGHYVTFPAPHVQRFRFTASVHQENTILTMIFKMQPTVLHVREVLIWHHYLPVFWY